MACSSDGSDGYKSNSTSSKMINEDSDDKFEDASDEMNFYDVYDDNDTENLNLNNYEDAKDTSFSLNENLMNNLKLDNQSDLISEPVFNGTHENDENDNSDKECNEIIIDDEYILAQENKLTDEILEERKLKSQNLKNEGNSLFKDGKFDESIIKYTEALDVCPRKYPIERSVLYSNRGACRMHSKQFTDGIDDSTKALDLNPNYLKALLRRAQMYEQNEKLDESLEDYKKCLELDPSIHQAREACMRLPGQINERNEKMKEEMMGKLKDLGNMCLKPFGLSTNNFQMTQNPDTGSYSINFQQNNG